MNLNNNLANNNIEAYLVYSIWDFKRRDHLGLTTQQIKGSCPIGIPMQCIIRFSKPGDIVFDPFCGAGTTLLACAYLKRYGFGVEINQNIIAIAKKNLSGGKKITKISNWIDSQKIIKGNSIDIMNYFFKENTVDLVFAHPPYWNLINYSKHYSLSEGDLSLEKQLSSFLIKIDLMFQGIKKILKKNNYACVLIGDVFIRGGKNIPLDYYFTKIALENEFEYITKIIKLTRNAESRRDKLKYWTKRSIDENIFICIHDYLLIFKNRKKD